MTSFIKKLATLIMTMMLVVGGSNIPRILDTTKDLFNLQSAILNSAKFEGGFHDRTIEIKNALIAESSLNRDKLNIVLSPGEYKNVSKREVLAVHIEYDFDIEIFTPTGKIISTRTIKLPTGRARSYKYFK